MSRENKPERNELEAMVVAMGQGQELVKAILRRMQERGCTLADYHRLMSEETGPWFIERLIDEVRDERTRHLTGLRRWSKAFTAKDLAGHVVCDPVVLEKWHLDWEDKGSHPLNQLRGLGYTQSPNFTGMLKWCQRGFTVKQAKELGRKMVDRYAPMGYHAAKAIDAISAAISMHASDKNACFAFVALGSTNDQTDGRDGTYLVAHSQDKGLPRLCLDCMNQRDVIEQDLDVLYVKNMPSRPVFV